MNREQYVKEHMEELVALIKTLCAIPAPSNNERKRAEFCRDWLQKAGYENAYIDEADNAVCELFTDEYQEIALLTAHTDTVFPDLTPFSPYEKEGRLYCPAVGDDTANLAVLLLSARYFLQCGKKPNRGLVFAANSGEEGLGNLRGIRNLMKTYGGRVGEMVSFDGTYLNVCHRAVGSMRYKVTLRTEGGHSFGNFGNQNAIYMMANMIQTLYAMKPPAYGESKTTYNVGMMEGGTSVNSIAEEAHMLYEYRSDDARCLKEMGEKFEAVIAAYKTLCRGVSVEVLGERPCGGKVDEKTHEALKNRAAAAIAKVYGEAPSFSSGSTDCNLPLSLGVPAICFGAYIGKGAHTRGEYIELQSLAPGFQIILDFINGYYE